MPAGLGAWQMTTRLRLTSLVTGLVDKDSLKYIKESAPASPAPRMRTRPGSKHPPE